MRVSTYQAHNVMGVKDIDFSLEGRHLFLVGGDNEQGKTSAINALKAALCGRSGMDWPDVVLRDGESEGWVRVNLTPDAEGEKGLTVELGLKKGRNGAVAEKFRITDGAGTEAPQPRALLQKLYTLRAFDPREFERLDRKAKRDLLKKVVNLDFSALDAEYQAVYSDRAATNKHGVRLKGKCDAMPSYHQAGTQEANIGALLAEKANREAHNANNQKERVRLEEMQKKENDCQQVALATAREIAGLQDRLAKLLKDLEHQEAQVEQATLLADAQAKTVAVLEDKDVDEVTVNILMAETLNQQVRANLAKAEVEKEVDGLRKHSQELSDRLRAIEEEKQKALAEAKWPIPGLSVDEDGVLYNGLPFEQASKSKRIIVSTLIGMALNPDLKLLICEDGSDLGVSTLESLEELLKTKGYQMIVEVVTKGKEDEDRCAVVIEGGAVKTKPIT